MSKKKETIFAEKIDRDLYSTFGTDIVVENIQQVTKFGTADRFICLCGFFVALEIKTEEGEASAIQTVKLVEVIKAGGIGLIVTPNNWGKILRQLKILAELVREFNRKIVSSFGTVT